MNEEELRDRLEFAEEVIEECRDVLSQTFSGSVTRAFKLTGAFLYDHEVDDEED